MRLTAAAAPCSVTMHLTLHRSVQAQVMELVELVPLRGALVGMPGSTGLSVEQRKRLTIAVELVANPSIIFMDEPTTGEGLACAAMRPGSSMGSVLLST